MNQSKINQTTQATVVFLRDNEGRICLAQKKKPIHHAAGEIRHSLGTWNGYGGKKEGSDLTIEDTAVRELLDEAQVASYKGNLIPCGHIFFYWPKNISDVADMEVYFYFLDIWGGDPKESNEMGQPQFFAVGAIPYDDMMEGDRVILPRMLTGEMVEGYLYLGKKDQEGETLFVSRK